MADPVAFLQQAFVEFPRGMPRKLRCEIDRAGAFKPRQMLLAEAEQFLRQGGASTGQAITIDASNNSLTGLRDAINNAKAGDTATTMVTAAAARSRFFMTLSFRLD